MTTPDYSLAIPVLKPQTLGEIAPLLLALAAQTSPPLEVHCVVGDPRQGRAINYAARHSKGKYFGTLDDDSLMDDPGLFHKLMAVLEADATVGMAGAACEIPPHALPLQRRAMLEIPRRFFPRQPETLDSDMVQHPCLLMPRELFLTLGGEDEELVRGLDPVLRKKVRDAGRRVVIAANTWVYHLLPPSLSSILRMYYRNGRGSAFGQRHFPERVLELTDGYDRGSFPERRPFLLRMLRRVLSSGLALARGQWVGLAASLAYSAGYAAEVFRPSASPRAPRVESVASETRHDYPFAWFIHHVRLARD